MSHLIRNHPPRRQQGVSTLLIAMLLLAILTIITLFAARYGVNEQRTSGNEYRYKMAFHVAEAGLNQSLEFVKVNTATMLSTATGGWLDPGAMQWPPCSVATSMVPDPCLDEPDLVKRAGMFRYMGSSNGVLPVSSAGMPPLSSVGGFTASYRAFATLCRLDTTNPTAPVCSLAPTTGGGQFYVTVVSRGTLDNENAVATVSQSFGTFSILGAGAPPAPLMATGGLGSGNMEIIPNPNGGGVGNPISIWSNAVVDTSGSFDTCQIDEWKASASKTSAQDLLNNVCDVNDCSCQKLPFGYGRISGSYQGTKVKGGDILDTTTHVGADGVTYLPSKWYPPDLFEYTFGVPSSQGTVFLTANATPINGCGSLNQNSSGFFWNASGSCSVGSAGTIQSPVVLVSDTPVTLAAGSQFFGMIYVRNTSATSFTANGNWQIYGAVITEGGAKLTGTPSLIYSKLALDNIRNSPGFIRYGPVPGSWSDSFPDQ
jgi:Tfp pilus assembly protein PilX